MRSRYSLKRGSRESRGTGSPSIPPRPSAAPPAPPPRRRARRSGAPVAPGEGATATRVSPADGRVDSAGPGSRLGVAAGGAALATSGAGPLSSAFGGVAGSGARAVAARSGSGAGLEGAGSAGRAFATTGGAGFDGGTGRAGGAAFGAGFGAGVGGGPGSRAAGFPRGA